MSAVLLLVMIIACIAPGGVAAQAPSPFADWIAPAEPGPFVPHLWGRIGGVPTAVFAIPDATTRVAMVVEATNGADVVGAGESAPPGWAGTVSQHGGIVRQLREERIWQAQWTRPIAGQSGSEWLTELREVLGGADVRNSGAYLLLEVGRADLAQLKGAGFSERAEGVLAKWPAAPVVEATTHPGGRIVRVDPTAQLSGPRLRVAGPRYGDPDGEALLIFGAAMNEQRGLRGMTVGLRDGRWWLELPLDLASAYYGIAPTVDIVNRAGAVAEHLRDEAHAVPSSDELLRLRDQLMLRRALAFELPGGRLDQVARRLANGGWNALLAEHERDAGVDRARWSTALHRWLDAPHWIVELPATNRAGRDGDSDRLHIERRPGYTVLHRRADGDVFSVTVLERLPAPEAWGPNTFDSYPLESSPSESRVGLDWSRYEYQIVREEAALAWRARLIAALNRHSESAARVAIGSAALLPGAEPDPLGSNQFVAVSMQASRNHADDLLLVLGDLLRAAPSPPAYARQMATSELRMRLASSPNARLDWMGAVGEQADLYGDAGAALFARRLEVVGRAGFGDRIGDRIRWELTSSADTLFIAVEGPPLGREFFAYFDSLLAPAAARGRRPRELAPPAEYSWRVPRSAAADDSRRDKNGAAVPRLIALDSTSDKHAAALLVAPLLNTMLMPEIGSDAAVSVVEFGEGLALVVPPVAEMSATEVEAVRGWPEVAAARERLLTSGGGTLESAVTGLREQALRTRARNAARASWRTFSWARNQALYLDPWYSDDVTDALAEVTVDDVRAFVESME